MWLLALAVTYTSAYSLRPRTNDHKQDDCIAHGLSMITHGLPMITHSRKAVDEDGRLCICVVFSSIYTSLLPIKTDSFIHYLFARNNIHLRLHICCTPDPQQSLRLFNGPVATSHLREQFVPRVERAYFSEVFDSLYICIRA